ncbi:MAG: AraC family transcriptional regulator [Bacteroidales bacterium]|nr:AraC family transcriptional regulator [Bacteroidales bacterium]
MATINRNRILLILLFSLFNNTEVLCIETKADSLNRLLKTSEGTEKIEILNELITAYDTISYIKSLDYANQALELTRKYKSKEEVAASLDRIGKIQFYLNDYDKSIDYFLESLKIREKFGNKKEVSESYNNIGVIYLHLANYNKTPEYLQKALKYLQKAWNISENVEDKTFLKKLSVNLGIVYTQLADYDKSLEYYKKALNISKETSDNKMQSVCLNNIGIIYWYLEDYNKSLVYYLEALKINEKIRDKWSIANTSRNIGEVYIKLLDYNNSSLYLNKGLKIAEEINSKHLIKDLYVTFSELYYAKGDHKKAYEYHKLYSKVKESIFTEETGKNIAETEVKFETEKKEKEILQQKKIRNIYLIAFVFFISAIITVFIEYRKKNSAYKFLVKKNIDMINNEKELKNFKEYIITNKLNNTSSTTVTDDKKEEILCKLKQLFENDKIFKDFDLTIIKLAKYLSTNRSYLSKIINDEFGKNFSDFSNEYKIKEAVYLLSDPQTNSRLSIAGIAKESGFRSVSKFNPAFKKFTGITPSKFRNEATA